MAVVDTLQINIETNATKAVTGIDRLTSSLTHLGKTTNGIGSFKGLSSGLTSMNVSLMKSTTLTKSLTSAVSSLALKYMGLRGIITGIRKSIDLSSDLTEQNNVVYTVFGEYSDKVEELAKNSNEALGLSELTTKQIASRFQQLGTSLGIAKEEAAEMSVQLTKLSADAGSMFNRNAEDMMTALQGIYTGQSRPLQNSMGLDIKQAAMDAYLLSQGVEESFQKMDAAEKAAWRYKYVLEKLAYTQDDFIKTQDTWANRVRILAESFKSLGTVLGGVFINVFKPVVKAMNNVVSAVTKFVKMVADALGTIFGWTLEISTSAISDDIGEIDTGLSDASSGADDTASGLGDANKQAKELKKTILGFDELNVLNGETLTPTSGSGSGGNGDSGSGVGGTDDGGVQYAIKHAESIFQKYDSEIKTLEGLGNSIRDALIEAMDSINWPSVYAKAAGFGKGLAEFMNGLFADDESGKNVFGSLGTTIAKSINTVLNATDAFAREFDFTQFGNALATGVDTYVRDMKWELLLRNAKNWGTGVAQALESFLTEDTFKNVGTAIAGKLNASLEFLSSFGDEFFGESKGKEFGNSIASGVNTFVDKFTWNKVGKSFDTWSNGLLDTIIASLGKIKWGNVGTKIRNALLEVDWSTKLQKVGTAVWNGINAAIDFSSGLLDTQSVHNTLTRGLNVGLTIANAINNTVSQFNWSAIGTTLSDWAKLFVGSLEGFIVGTDWQGIGSSIGTALSKIEWGTLLNSFGRSFWGAVNGAIDFTKGFFKTSGLSNPIVDAAMGVIDSIKTQVNNFQQNADVKGLVTALEKLAVALEPFVSGFVEGLGEGFVSIVNGIRDILKTLATWVKQVDPVKLEAIGKAIGALTLVLLELKTVSGLAKLGTSLTSFAGGLTAVGSVSAASLLGVVGAATALAAFLSAHSRTINDAIFTAQGYEGKEKEVKLDTSKYGMAVREGVMTDDQAKSLGLLDSVQELLDEKTLENLRSEVKSANGELNIFASTASAVYQKLKANGKMTDEWSDYFNELGTSSTTAQNGIGAVFTKSGELLGLYSNKSDGMKLVAQYIKDLGENSGTALTPVEKIKESAKGFSTVMSTLGEKTGNTSVDVVILGNKIKEALPGVSNIRDLVSKGTDTGSSSFNGSLLTLVENFGNTSTSAKDAATNVEGFDSYLGSVEYSSATEQIGNVGNKIGDLATNSEDGEKKYSFLNRVLNSTDVTSATNSISGVNKQVSDVSTNSTDAQKEYSLFDRVINSTDFANPTEHMSGVVGKIKDIISGSKDGNKEFSLFDQVLNSANYDTPKKSINNVSNEILGVAKNSSDGEQKVGWLSRAVDTFASNSRNNGIEIEQLKTASDNVTKAFGGVGTAAIDVEEDIKTMSADIGAEAPTAKANGEKVGGGVISGITTALGQTVLLVGAAVLAAGLVTKAFDIKDSMEANGSSAIGKFKSGLNNKDVKPSDTAETIASKVLKKFDIDSDMETYGSSAIKQFKYGLNNYESKTELLNAASGLASDLADTFDIDLYYKGQEVSRSFANGIRSISLPYTSSYSNWDWERVGDSWVKIPYVSVRWNALGGYYTGPQLIGVGEAGDEAVIPLTNQKTMKNIANAITNQMDTGIGDQNIEKAVYQGVMAANQNNRTDINVTLEGDVDKLFRAFQNKGKVYQRTTGKEVFA